MAVPKAVTSQAVLRSPAAERNKQPLLKVLHDVIQSRDVSVLEIASGFTKCGTTDFHTRLELHDLVLSGNIYVRAIKEMHWWDNFHFDPYHKFSLYSRLYLNATANLTRIVRAQLRMRTIDLDAQPIMGDFTPRTVWHADRWHTEPGNQGLHEPKELIPHKVKHVLPDAKIIILMRNPTFRLLSDYNFVKFDHTNTSAQDFHDKVATAIRWWKDCRAMGLTEKRCAYGYYYPDELQPPLDFTDCVLNPREGCLEHLPGNTWHINPAARMRIGLYNIFVKEWVSLFPRIM